MILVFAMTIAYKLQKWKGRNYLDTQSPSIWLPKYALGVAMSVAKEEYISTSESGSTNMLFENEAYQFFFILICQHVNKHDPCGE